MLHWGMRPAILVEGLSKRFGRTVAVRDVSFSVAAGEMVGLLGPNGAGKTTTIQMLLGIITPAAGRPPTVSNRWITRRPSAGSIRTSPSSTRSRRRRCT